MSKGLIIKCSHAFHTHFQRREFKEKKICIDDFILIYFIISNVSNTIFIIVNLQRNITVNCTAVRNTIHIIYGFCNQKNSCNVEYKFK